MRNTLLASCAVMALAATEVSAEENWCDESPGQTAVCVIGAVGLLALFLMSDSGGSGSDYRHSDNQSGSAPPPPSFTYESPSYEAAPDTSAGCAWGDRAYGTCH